MRASTLPMFLIGRREAIVEVAQSPSAIGYGVLFVLSAGLAREYDGQDLVHEPWHAVAPLGVSLVAGTVLFVLVHLIALSRGRLGAARPPTLARAYRTFITLFWMTAPLAWLYAIPYERFMSPVGAMEANLWTLALVAGWRVLLITRVISVVYGVNAIAAFFVVMLFADGVVWGVLSYAPVPMINIMGGIRHSPQDALLASTAFGVQVLSIISAPVWILGTLMAVGFFKPHWLTQSLPRVGRQGKSLRVVVGLALTLPLAAMAFTQPEQIRRHEVERLLRVGRVAEGLEVMSQQQPGDYPPYWDPPPRLGYGERAPDLAAVRDATIRQWPADWVATLYLDKIRRRVWQATSYLYPGDESWEQIADRFEESRLAYGMDALREQRSMIEFLQEYDPTVSANDRAAIERLLAMSAPSLEEKTEEDH